jgi:hypothetical protein
MVAKRTDPDANWVVKGVDVRCRIGVLVGQINTC